MLKSLTCESDESIVILFTPQNEIWGANNSIIEYSVFSIE